MPNGTPISWKSLARQWAPPIFVDQIRRRRQKRGPAREFLLPVKSLEELFPGIETARIEVNPAVLDQVTDEMGLPLRELLTLGAICRHAQPRAIFEFGTYTGVSTLVLALNSPESAHIHTLDLDPAARARHVHGLGVGNIAPYDVGAVYRTSPLRYRIHQLYGNSPTYDFHPYHGAMDLIFVDADHSYAFVSQDTANAFRMVSPRGIIIWDDYIWREHFPECAGVAQCLHDAARSKPLCRVAGTRFAVYAVSP